MKSRFAASEGSAAVRQIGRRRICSMGGARDRGEQRKTQKAGEKTANMRLPGAAGAGGADRNRSDAEDNVDGEPDAEKSQPPAVAQGAHQRQRRHPGRGIGVAAAERQEAAFRKSKTDPGPHGAG